MQQLSLTFEPGLAQRSRCLRDHMTTRIYGPHYGGLVAVAGKLDMAPSKLSEKLTGADSGGKVRGMTLDDFERYIEATGDVSPIHYLVDKYLREREVLSAEALAELTQLAQKLPALLALAGVKAKPGRAQR